MAADKARAAADSIRAGTGYDGVIHCAIIAGTGWSEVLAFDELLGEMGIKDIHGFENFGTIEGHVPRLAIGRIGIHVVLVLFKRVHMNEDTFNPVPVRSMARLQIEMLNALGIDRVIVTAGVGGLTAGIQWGDVGVVTSMVTNPSDVFPLFPGEFGLPEDPISQGWSHDVFSAARDQGGVQGLRLLKVCHAIHRGSHFETFAGKRHFARMGGDIVGMSGQPECAVAAVFVRMRVLFLTFVTNDAVEPMSHEKHCERARQSGSGLNAVLRLALTLIPG